MRRARSVGKLAQNCVALRVCLAPRALPRALPTHPAGQGFTDPVAIPQIRFLHTPISSSTMGVAMAWALVDNERLRDLKGGNALAHDEVKIRRLRSSPAAFANLSKGNWLKRAQHEACPVCVNTAFQIQVPGDWGGACFCEACSECIERWVELKLPDCIAAKQLRIKCMTCEKSMPQKLVLACSSKAAALAHQLERREELQANPFFPLELQEDCRRIDCVGIGYHGYETVMCMICEEQWDADEEATHIGSFKPEDVDAEASIKDENGKTVIVKRCPRCKVFISKNGGCNHMRCALCKHEFWWNDLRPYSRA
jgi:hypothetical protein